MKLKSLLLLSLFSTILISQSCRKENTNIIPTVTEDTTHHDDEHWNYEHPETWGGLSTDCDGVIQSPIDIITFSTIKSGLPDLVFSYADFPISILDNGHTIQVNTNANDAGNSIMFNNKTYKLKQFHFHSKSEHTINGKHAPMEMHLVHISDGGEILVVGLMIEEGSAANTLIDKVWNNLPSEKEHEEAKTAFINMNNVLPVAKGYYNYIGSLTTPPCSMGLQWIVMKESLMLSKGQIEVFEKLYNHNYRPTQKLNNRVVFEKI